MTDGRVAGFVALFCCFLAFSTAATAQSRAGSTFSVLAGQASTEGDAGRFRLVVLNLMGGRMVTPKLAIQAELGFGESREEVPLCDMFVLGSAAQYWVAPRLWIRGGAGYGAVTTSARSPTGIVGGGVSHAGLFLTGAIGVEFARYEFTPELARGRNLAVDLQYQDRILPFAESWIHVPAVVIGINFYRR